VKVSNQRARKRIGVVVFPKLPCFDTIKSNTRSFSSRIRLCKIAAPDTVEPCATNLGVVVGGEDLGVAGLALVRPAFGHGGANTVKAGESGDLAEPSANEDGHEGLYGVLTRSENLTVGAGVELVRHDTSACGDTV
jgi:hypothetical protein